MANAQTVPDDFTLMTKDEVLRLAKLHATPIDFDALIEQGVLEKKGAWYAILDMERLPEHAKRRVKSLKSPNLAKFYPAKKTLK